MKILAVIPTKHGKNDYIVEVSSPEILSITLLSGYYAKIPVTNIEKQNLLRDNDKLEVGDFIDPQIAAERREAFAEYVNARKEIEKSMASLRGAMTKLGNLTAPSSIPD